MVDFVKSEMLELLKSLALAGILAFLVITFILQGFYIPSGSMRPTLEVGDRIFVNKFIYRFREPARGDLMVFRYPIDPTKKYIKRLIGLGGEVLEIQGGQVFIQGEAMVEDYLLQEEYGGSFGPVRIPEGEYFVLGDNRNNSEDSRFWGFVPHQEIVGQAFFVFWPPRRIGPIR